MKKKDRITWLDTYGDGGYCYDDYKEWCEEDGVEPAGEGSLHYQEWIGKMICADVDDFYANLKYSDCRNVPVVISGYLGLWWGRPQIENTIENNLSDAIHICADGVDDVQVYSERGVVYVVGLHHDGRNLFEIRPLTPRGVAKMERGEDICVGNHWHTGKFPKYLF